MHQDSGTSGSTRIEPQVGRSVSLDQAAACLGVSRRTIYNWIRAGRLQTIRTLGGASQRVVLASLREFASARTRPLVAGAGESGTTGQLGLS